MKLLSILIFRLFYKEKTNKNLKFLALKIKKKCKQAKVIVGHKINTLVYKNYLNIDLKANLNSIMK